MDMPTLDSPVASGDPSITGQWEPVMYCCEYLPIHTALLHTGKVLAFGGTGNNHFNFGHPHPAELWDPQTGAIKLVDQDLSGDLFCAGHTFLADGRLLVAGGTLTYDVKRHIFGAEIPLPPFAGMNQSYLFDPVLEHWTRGDDMAVGRWYPTLITLGDGRVIAMAGFTEHFPWVVLRKIEIYAEGEGWQPLKGADRWLPLYPRLHLLPDGRVFYSGSYNTHYTFPFSLSEFPTSILNLQTRTWDWLGLPNKSEREEGATVLLPLDPPDYTPRVLLAGGGTPTGADAIADCEMIDLSQKQPHWELIEPMHHPRYYVYAVQLPDGKILALGGRAGTKGHDMPPSAAMGMDMPTDGTVAHDPRSVMEPEMFDPLTRQWTCMAPMTVDRLYHSSAILLPDGRVATFGNNPMQGVDELRIEIYHPPYLFCGPRPVIQQASTVAAYGQEIEILSTQAADIDQVALIKPTATTHCVNTEQRLVRLEFHRGDSDHITASVPGNRNLLPPGYYMLFILSGGVPSEAKWVLIQG